MYKRVLDCLPSLETSFFLLGPRQVGKSTLLKHLFPDAVWVDLLKSDEFARYSKNPHYLREELILKKPEWVIIDEVQKVPQLLNEVHYLIENANIKFGLCGSSARKLKQNYVNLLGGRAIRYELFGLISEELKKDFDLEKILNHGYLPKHINSKRIHQMLEAYVSDYLKNEVAFEGLTRNLQTFSTFLDVAALSDTELINFSNIARECGISSHSVKEYFQILEDTLIGKWLVAHTKSPKRRVVRSPKFYFNDVGVVNFLSKRRNIQIGSPLFGKAFENWVFHELTALNSYSEKRYELTYWRLSSGIEVDFIISELNLAIEAKATNKISGQNLKGLRELAKEHPQIKNKIVVSLEKKKRLTDDGILILPYKNFIPHLKQIFKTKVHS